MVRAHWNGVVIAESDDTVIVDGNHYFPISAVDEQYLVASETTTVCPWKGRASYYSLQVGDDVNRNAAWYYPTPTSAAAAIAGRMAFWHGVKIEDAGRGAQRRSVFDRLRRRPAGTATVAAATPGHDHDHDHDHDHHDHDHHELDAGLAALQTWADAPPVEQVVVDLDDADFFARLDDRVSIVDFWAPWCGPCTTFHPQFAAAARRHAGEQVQFVRVNVDDAPGVAAAFGIMSIPTLLAFDRFGHEIDREIGVPSTRRLEQIVRHAIAMAADRDASEHGVAERGAA